MLKLHDGGNADADLTEVRRGALALAEGLRDESRGDAGLAHDALQESVEALLLGAVLRDEALFGPAELAIEPEIYLSALGDLAGELRRVILGRLRAGDLPGADRYLGTLDALYRTLMRFDTTRAIVALKPKQDTARSLLERTRGEVTLAHLLGRANLPAPRGAEP